MHTIETTFVFFHVFAAVHSMWDFSSPTGTEALPPALEAGNLTP